MSTSRRLGPLRNSLEEKGLDGILVSSGPNRRYLSGFTGSAGYLLVTETDTVLATDFRYIEQAGQPMFHFDIVVCARHTESGGGLQR